MRQFCVLHREEIITKTLPLHRLCVHQVRYWSSQKLKHRFCVQSFNWFLYLYSLGRGGLLNCVFMFQNTGVVVVWLALYPSFNCIPVSTHYPLDTNVKLKCVVGYQYMSSHASMYRPSYKKN